MKSLGWSAARPISNQSLGCSAARGAGSMRGSWTLRALALRRAHARLREAAR